MIFENIAEEEWRAVPGYEGTYEVSDLGRVRSLDRVVSYKGGRSKNPTDHKIKGRTLSQTTKRSGHKKVSLSIHGTAKDVHVHTLVVLAFHGPKPRGENVEVRHLNGDPSDNRASNLKWGTRWENNEDMKIHGVHPTASKTACKRGHTLEIPNLIKSELPYRRCRACTYARNSGRWRGEKLSEAELQERADRYYGK